MNGKTTLPALNRKGFRLTTVNQIYSVCRTYPAAIIVPFRVTDESVKKVARGHKHGRFPAITWISEGGAMLVRCGGFHVKSGLRKLANQAQQSTQGKQNFFGFFL